MVESALDMNAMRASMPSNSYSLFRPEGEHTSNVYNEQAQGTVTLDFHSRAICMSVRWACNLLTNLEDDLTSSG